MRLWISPVLLRTLNKKCETPLKGFSARRHEFGASAAIVGAESPALHGCRTDAPGSSIEPSVGSPPDRPRAFPMEIDFCVECFSKTTELDRDCPECGAYIERRQLGAGKWVGIALAVLAIPVGFLTAGSGLS